VYQVKPFFGCRSGYCWLWSVTLCWSLIPGGQFFNLFNLGSTPQSMKDLRYKEVKNGRLAMIAVFGYGAQAVMTGKGPFQNLLDHLADPINNNILANFHL
jgi:light-harvesting complex I chlorophyll a/b binding protein 3